MDQPATSQVVSGDSSFVNVDDASIQNRLDSSLVNGDDASIQNSDLVVIRSSYKPYFAFMAILVPWIPQMLPSGIRTYPVRMTTFFVSMCINFIAFMLRLMTPLPFMTKFTAGFFSGTFIFTGILSPCALLSIFLPDWLSLLGLPLIIIISVVIIAPNLLPSLYKWLYQKVEYVIVRIMEKLRARVIRTGQTTGQTTESEDDSVV